MQKFYTPEDIADRYCVSQQTVWRWIRQKKLPAVKIGKLYRIRPEDLSLFEQDTVPTTQTRA